jgi:hypothetical protein
MMAKRKTTKRRQRHDPCIQDRAPIRARAPHSAGLPHAIPLPIPTYWTPEQAIAVFELVDDLRETIWSIYQTKLQDLTRQQRQSPPVDHIDIGDDDLPF